MELIPIRFGSLYWELNPSEIRVDYENNEEEELYLGKTSSLSKGGMKLRKVKGKGVFFGEDKLEKYAELEGYFLNSAEEMLILPGTKPFKASFTFLRQYYPEGSDHLGYEFTFTECETKVKENPSKIKAMKDESLWDIAYRFGADIDKLVALNTHIENINYLKENEEVYL